MKEFAQTRDWRKKETCIKLVARLSIVLCGITWHTFWLKSFLLIHSCLYFTAKRTDYIQEPYPRAGRAEGKTRGPEKCWNWTKANEVDSRGKRCRNQQPGEFAATREACQWGVAHFETSRNRRIRKTLFRLAGWKGKSGKRDRASERIRVWDQIQCRRSVKICRRLIQRILAHFLKFNFFFVLLCRSGTCKDRTRKIDFTQRSKSR